MNEHPAAKGQPSTRRIVSVRISQGEQEAIHELCERLGMSQSEVMRFGMHALYGKFIGPMDASRPRWTKGGEERPRDPDP